MESLGVDIMITGSQKALACPPGISIMVLSNAALQRIEDTKCCCQYFDLKLALKNQREDKLHGLQQSAYSVKLMYG